MKAICRRCLMPLLGLALGLFVGFLIGDEYGEALIYKQFGNWLREPLLYGWVKKTYEIDGSVKLRWMTPTEAQFMANGYTQNAKGQWTK